MYTELPGFTLHLGVKDYSAGLLFTLHDYALLCRITLFSAGLLFSLQNYSFLCRITLFSAVLLLTLQDYSLLCRITCVCRSTLEKEEGDGAPGAKRVYHLGTFIEL